MAEMPPDTITGPLFAAIRDFREWLAGPPAPDEQVRTWKICTPEQEWSGGVWCSEPDCGCVAESSEIGEFREGVWTEAELHAAIGEHIATQAERRAEERATALDHHDWARDARFAAKHPAPHEGDETVMIQFDNRSGHWIPDHPGTVDVSEHVDGPIEQVDRG